MLDNMFFSVLEVSLSVSIIVVMLLFCAPLFNKRYAMKWKYLIWLFLAIRLLMPFDIEDVRHMAGKFTEAFSGIRQEAQQSESEDRETSPDEGAARQRIVVEIPAQVTEPLVISPGAESGSFTLLMIMEGIWLVGAVLFLAVHIGSYLRYKRQIVQGGRPVEDSYVLRQLTSLLHALQIKNKVRIMRYQEAASPMVMGIVHPVLILPDREYRQEELFFILKHELVHLKRHDVCWKLLFVAANAVHWFNPLIWIMRREAVVDMELSCDEKVMQGAAYAERKAYTETLLSMLHKQCNKGSALTTQFYGGKQIMKKRFRNILQKTKGKNGLAIMLCAIFLTVSLGVLIGCSVSESENSSEDVRTEDNVVAEGIVADGIDVPETVLEQAKILVKSWFQEARESDAAANYRNYRIESLAECYTYEDFHGMTLQVYQLNHEFLSDTPENIQLVGGMSVTGDGWVTPDYPNSRFLIFRQDEDIFSFLLCLMENDCLPGDDLFTGDLENRLEEEGFLTASEGAAADTTTLTYMMEGEAEEEIATLFIGSGYSLYIPDNYSLYAPDAWSYVYNEQIRFWVTHFENQDLVQVQAELASSHGMDIVSEVLGESEMAGQQGELISRVRLIAAGQDVWGVFYTYPEEAVEGAGARLPVIIDTFAVTGTPDNGQEWQSRPPRRTFWDFAPETNLLTGNTLYFANGLQVILPEEWMDDIVMEISYGPGEGNNGDTLIVCEESNAQAGVGGVLFYMHYIDKDYYEFSAQTPYQMFGEHIDRVLGIYQHDGHEYALVFELPREMNYVEGNDERKKAYEDIFAAVEQVRIVTDNMEDFTECGVDDIDWVVYMD